MLNSLCRIGVTAALCGLLFVPSISLAQDKRVRHVQDDAKLFKKDAIEQADKIVTKIKDVHKKDLLIETVTEAPEKDFNGWAKERFNNAAVDGVFVLLVKKGRKYHIDVGNETLRQGYFTRADIKSLEDILLKKTTDPELLSRIANFTLESMNEHHKPAKVEQPAKKPAPVQRGQPVVHDPVQQNRENAMPPWVGWVCTILAILFVVWVVFAVIRAMTSFGGGGYGYGGGGYGYGGGGGGFFTGMLGGLFGSMAGMWLYNNMFGGHANYRNDGSVDWGGGGTSGSGGGESYQGDTDVGASAGGDADGGDWGGGGGGDAGGGDAGGGGDWGGGGGDAGGGDDWGGGGGDAGGGGDWGGGGGGGDWGGGGGGDFGGGGGGDW